MPTKRTMVDRLLIGSGSEYNYYGHLNPFKFVGVVIEDKIFWVKRRFDDHKDMSNGLHTLNVHVEAYSSKWGNITCKNTVRSDKKATKLRHRDMNSFAENSIYVKKAVLAADGSLFWEVADIKAYFNGGFDICNEDCKGSCKAA